MLYRTVVNIWLYCLLVVLVAEFVRFVIVICGFEEAGQNNTFISLLVSARRRIISVVWTDLEKCDLPRNIMATIICYNLKRR